MKRFLKGSEISNMIAFSETAERDQASFLQDIIEAHGANALENASPTGIVHANGTLEIRITIPKITTKYSIFIPHGEWKWINSLEPEYDIIVV